MRSAMPRRLPSNPWSRPCSVDATWRVISPCDAAHDNPQSESSAMPTQNSVPVGASP